MVGYKKLMHSHQEPHKSVSLHTPTSFRCVRLPIFDDGVADARVWVVIWSRPAGLHKQLCVGDGGGRLDLHEDHLFEVHLHWVCAGINVFSEPLALKEFKLEGESTEAPLCEGVRVLVCESQSQVGSLWIDAGKGDLDVMLPGNYFIWVSRCDLVLKDDVVFVLLKMKGNEMLSLLAQASCTSGMLFISSNKASLTQDN